MNEDKPQYITASEFAKQKEVPLSAVIHALEAGMLPKLDIKVMGEEALIPIEQLELYEFELIGVYDYADRKNVSYRAVYNKIDKGFIKYSLEENSDVMKIDWKLYHNVHFRSVVFKHRGRTNYKQI